MARQRVSARDLEKQIRDEILVAARNESILDEENAKLANEIKRYIQQQTPKVTGDAVGSIKVKKVRKPKNGLPARVVFSDSPLFHMIEYGTKSDPDTTKDPRRVQIDGEWVTLGRDTPTKAAAPFGKAKAKYGDGS